MLFLQYKKNGPKTLLRLTFGVKTLLRYKVRHFEAISENPCQQKLLSFVKDF